MKPTGRRTGRLAIIHDLGTTDRLEYPIGKTLYEAGVGYLSDPRVSPDGSRVAFLEHPDRYDDRGWLKVVDRGGMVRTLAGEFWGAEGVAWSPDGATLFFSSARACLLRLLPTGRRRQRPATSAPGLSQHRFSGDDGHRRPTGACSWISVRPASVCGRSCPGETVEREFPWLDLPLAVDMSDDGKWLLFSDQGQSAGLNYAVALRKTDGTRRCGLVKASAIALSPDGKWAIGNVPSPAPGRFVLYPTGAGQPKPLDIAPVTASRDIDWLDNERIFLCGSELDQPPRCYTKAVSGRTASGCHCRRHHERVDPTRRANHPGRGQGRALAARRSGDQADALDPWRSDRRPGHRLVEGQEVRLRPFIDGRAAADRANRSGDGRANALSRSHASGSSRRYDGDPQPHRR